MAELTPLGDLITVHSRQVVYAEIEKTTRELARELGLSMEEADKIWTRLFVVVMQVDVRAEKPSE